MNTSGTLVTLTTTTKGPEIEKLELNDDYKQLNCNKEWWFNTIAYTTVVGGLGNILTFFAKRIS